MILQLLEALMPLPEEKGKRLPGMKDERYWHSGYFIRIFREEYGVAWQVYRDNKFVHRGGRFVALIDGGLCESLCAAHRSAQEYIDNCLWEPEAAE
ncbi:MAG: hypothetical protein JGK17_07705 [Microcoleus sp. PH2017_10_PVI_O_A]|uniref:hypothetical protein n=1 Tax=unclassified Microcoleus TaxID=2642155 RepID=UPI001D3E1E51|nr:MULTISPECIES: hypothetical protein [unclassified Microcoleus]TAE84352.1 MAG: hypothetical protein EAZ83_06610 [Oscillatoriales cyanobacterium]MCC3405467.1 hypothetical protein [Microcoleus sp. PH2017_10_PVI_O_A]MCC3461672.1 hypothetical protein [Microcoleus sp. PH2017_11_PCY_U_A]MCC3477569.1 hypothetical protein [Microcoleus sp. PH2017_12_PCY_D_A]MCC3532070.1 hypothetical protein [Microcoleus sp. PH2017_21_RUC_O_A]